MIALEWQERIDSRHWSWIANPLKCLPISNDEDIIHGIDSVEKFDETFFVVRLREPCGVVEETEWCSIRCVMSLKIFHNHLRYTISIGWIRACITHGTSSSIQILPHHHRHFPYSWIALRWTRWNHTI